MAKKPGTLSGHFTFFVVLVGFVVFALVLGFKSKSDKAGHRLRECVVNLEAIAERQNAVLEATGRYLSCARFPTMLPDADDPPTWRPSCELDHKVWTWYYEEPGKSSEGDAEDCWDDPGRFKGLTKKPQKHIQAEFRDGREDGVWKSWYEDGLIRERGHYKEGVQDGHWTVWFDKGKQRQRLEADLGGPVLLPETLVSRRSSQTGWWGKELPADHQGPFAQRVQSRRSDADLCAEGARFRWADCTRRWQCHESQRVCWSPDARRSEDRDPVAMDTVPACWRQLMGLGKNMVLRGQYEVSAPAVATQGTAMQRFEASCRIDLDGNGDVTEFRATESKTTWKVVGR